MCVCVGVGGGGGGGGGTRTVRIVIINFTSILDSVCYNVTCILKVEMY